jgi:hypothetical protein
VWYEIKAVGNPFGSGAKIELHDIGLRLISEKATADERRAAGCEFIIGKKKAASSHVSTR